MAPNATKVAVSALAANEFVGCSEVQKDSVISDELSSTFKTTSETLKVDSEWLLEMVSEETKAKRACNDAIGIKNPQKKELYKIARELGELRSQSSQDLTSTLTKLNDIRDIGAA